MANDSKETRYCEYCSADVEFEYIGDEYGGEPKVYCIVCDNVIYV